MIELLTQNNWDESAAAQAFYAQQAQAEMNRPANNPAMNNANEDMYGQELNNNNADDGGVRRPIEYQED